jgi:hypothetical protein
MRRYNYTKYFGIAFYVFRLSFSLMFEFEIPVISNLLICRLRLRSFGLDYFQYGRLSESPWYLCCQDCTKIAF